MSYRIHVDTEALVTLCVERLNAQQFPKPMVVVEKGEFTSIRYTMQLVSVHHRQATLAITREARGRASEELVAIVERNTKLARAFGDERLRRFAVLDVIEAGDQSQLVFDEGDVELDLHTPYVFESLMGQEPREQVAIEPESTFPVFNLLDRGAREVGLTRPTINCIFKGLRLELKEMLLRNPEGFAGVFISVIRNTLADHVAEHLEFTSSDGTAPIDLEELFPTRKRFPQRELVEAGEHGLYDQVQTDSDVEVHFVQRLRADDKVVFYFKFPPAFKVRLPRIIGNYNPDWGIGRYDETGRLVLHLVRETKGSADETKLQFPHEKRKIHCAQEHFRVLGVDYRHVTDKMTDWWRPADAVAVQRKLGGG
jgi:type III restriction enzyme